jgi:hypothetical protein
MLSVFIFGSQCAALNFVENDDPNWRDTSRQSINSMPSARPRQAHLHAWHLRSWQWQDQVQQRRRPSRMRRTVGLVLATCGAAMTRMNSAGKRFPSWAGIASPTSGAARKIPRTHTERDRVRMTGNAGTARGGRRLLKHRGPARSSHEPTARANCGPGCHPGYACPATLTESFQRKFSAATGPAFR